MKKKVQQQLVKWFFEPRIKRFATHYLSKKEDHLNYLNDLLSADQIKMLGSRDGLLGNHDLDLEINRLIRKEISQYVTDQEQ